MLLWYAAAASCLSPALVRPATMLAANADRSFRVVVCFCVVAATCGDRLSLCPLRPFAATVCPSLASDLSKMFARFARYSALMAA